VSLRRGAESMKEYEHAVGKHYDESAFAGEHERLKRHPVEFRITLRALARWLPPRGAICAEIGVGTGAYSERLAEGGYSLHLVDVSARLLDATADRLRSGGYGALLLGTHRQSATDLEALQSGSCDAVIALGPCIT
jgi:S-adenosylmethionine-dependent methyltransferase